MRLCRLASLLFLPLLACGGPILQNAPAPNPAHVAAAAAAVAGTMTLADPDAAARRQEQNRPEQEKRELDNNETVPLEVLDRIDQAKAEEPSHE
jgi:hypothetical protein